MLSPHTALISRSHSERVRGRAVGQLLWRRGGGVAQLRGPGGDAESGLHHRLLLAQRHHPAAWYPDGQVRATPNSTGGQVMVLEIATTCRLMCESALFYVYT